MRNFLLFVLLWCFIKRNFPLGLEKSAVFSFLELVLVRNDDLLYRGNFFHVYFAMSHKEPLFIHFSLKLQRVVLPKQVLILNLEFQILDIGNGVGDNAFAVDGELGSIIDSFETENRSILFILGWYLNATDFWIEFFKLEQMC